MIYRSNLAVPDLQPHFAATTVCYPRHWSMGHDVLSDKDFDPDCGFMLHDEAAILYHCAKKSAGWWLDIGARFGWTTAHISAAGRNVTGIDPMYLEQKFEARTRSNIAGMMGTFLYAGTSGEYFNGNPLNKAGTVSGVCIDGNHDAPYPACDALNAGLHLGKTGVIVFHDFWGKPIRDGVEHLIALGFSCRTYDTPAGMAVCWRGDFTPPDHTPDPAIDWAAVRKGRAPEFDFARCV